jgi:DNA polymerase elongation subunit (family B)
LPQSLFFEKESKYNNFATAISPIGMVRGGSKEFREFYPAGTSIIDMLSWFKKIYKQEKSYALDAIMEKYLGKGKEFKNVDFSIINDDIKKRNIGDVIGMYDINKKFKLISFYDEIRRMAKINWEDFEYPMRVIDSLVLQEAKKRNIVLPSSRGEENRESEYEGAYRETFASGDFYDVSDYDLSSCYPSVIRDLCLDPQNIYTQNIENTIPINITDRKTQELIKTIYVKQNPNTILPNIMKELLLTKDKFKVLKKNTPTDDPDYENICLSYDAVKAITNTGYGAFGNRYFRLFSSDVVSLITSIARDLLHYLKDKLEENKYKVLYTDTDGCIVNDSGKDLSDMLNKLIQDWSMARFNKPSSITIEKKGTFKKLFLLTLCRYKGWIETPTGLKEEVKGVQILRKDSTQYIAKFQDILIEKIFNKETKEQIIEFIKSEMERIKTLPLLEIAFPARIGRQLDEYKTEVTNKSGNTYNKKPPVFIQAYQNMQKISPKWKKPLGDLFYWVYVTKDNEMMPMAFDEETQNLIKDVCWKKQIERNITNIVQTIFDAKHWENPFVPKKVKREKKNKEIIEPSNESGIQPYYEERKIKTQPIDLLDETKEVNPKFLSKPKEKIKKDYNEEWKKEWVGMPEFIQEDLSPFQKIIVNFETKEDINNFAKLIGHSLTYKTDTIWFPFKEIRNHKEIAYIDEP